MPQLKTLHAAAKIEDLSSRNQDPAQPIQHLYIKNQHHASPSTAVRRRPSQLSPDLGLAGGAPA